MSFKIKRSNRTYILIAGAGVFLVAVFLLLFLDFTHHKIYPVNDVSQYEIGTYHEDMDSNWTEVSFVFDDKDIVFSYSLTEERDEPFGAFYFRDADINKTLVDVKDFNAISVHLEAEKAQRIPITLRFHNDSYINLSKKFPEISITKVIDYKGPGKYRIYLDEFEIAAWWLRYHGIEKETIDLRKVTELKYLAIGSCQALEPGESDKIKIKEVEFYNKYTKTYVATGVFLGVLLLGLFLHYKFSSNKKTIVVKPVEIPEDKSQIKKADEVRFFIAENFQNAELSMYDVQKATGIKTVELRAIFKDELGDSFKGYLKSVRMAEVERLLLEKPDLSISEVAYKCGFNDIPYFNRQFKSIYGKTPKQFRNEE